MPTGERRVAVADVRCPNAMVVPVGPGCDASPLIAGCLEIWGGCDEHQPRLRSPMYRTSWLRGTPADSSGAGASLGGIRKFRCDERQHAAQACGSRQGQKKPGA